LTSAGPWLRRSSFARVDPANIGLEINVSERVLVVIGDATQLHQVVMNLCGNAIQAMKGTGTLRMEVLPTEFSSQRTLSRGTLRPGRYVCLVVEDSGCGMDEATLSHIFEPFFTTKEVGGGTGLGLSLVDTIVTDLAGAIDGAPAWHAATICHWPRSSRLRQPG
jgi:signal transduction histidine kinase